MKRRMAVLLASVALIVGMDLPDGCGGPAVPDSWKEPAINKERNYGSEYCRALKQQTQQGSAWDRASAMREHRKNCR